ncbi:AAA family ATPase, partial [Mycobacterium paraintracellulare]
MTNTDTDESWEAADAAREAAALFDERAVTAAWLDQQTFPPLEWIVEGILPEGMGLLAAPPKAGKSWMVANIGLACAAGGSAIAAIPVKQRPVLYLALEDGHRRLQSRFRTLMEGQELPADLEVVTRASSTESLVIIDEFLRRNQHKAPLVIIDTLGKVKPPKASWEDSYQADYRIGGALKTRIDAVPGGCLLLVHHTRKAESSDFIETVSGTQGIAGSADFVLVLSRKRHSDEAVLSVTGRDVNENEYALTTSNGRWALAGSSLHE